MGPDPLLAAVVEPGTAEDEPGAHVLGGTKGHVLEEERVLRGEEGLPIVDLPQAGLDGAGEYS